MEWSFLLYVIYFRELDRIYIKFSSRNHIIIRIALNRCLFFSGASSDRFLRLSKARKNVTEGIVREQLWFARNEIVIEMPDLNLKNERQLRELLLS